MYLYSVYPIDFGVPIQDMGMGRGASPKGIDLKNLQNSYDKQARKLQATLVRNYDPLTHWLTHWQE